MNDYRLNEFAGNICMENSISYENAKKIMAGLSEKELKKLLEKLKKNRDKITVTVISADTLAGIQKKTIVENFEGAQVHFETDSAIGAGIKIKTYDMIYDLTVKGRVEKLTHEIESEL